MMCHNDSCEQNHCSQCGCHTIGNNLVAGMCYDCYMLEEDKYQQEMEKLWKEKLAK